MTLRIWEGEGGRGGKVLSLILILDFSFFYMFITQKKDHFSKKKNKKKLKLPPEQSLSPHSALEE